ncbi:adenosylcobinamide-GDP ribazoletransferase [Phyllobacterium sp. YR531]|uniref:adenosylcobinamide-GDP ribazoletransferase n=1 Tax=Phyllobacterium sp. YR531 TaxID=1144343 RepID=UPI00026F6C82|nr:adenosylcobinamide-GDP ribazoletransferase [Phyllobacterium sp. YR531]EJN03904.1 cobalamin-5-phosphate synthase [Phyllobacterium sp. YR531]
MDLITDTMRSLAFLSRISVLPAWFEGYDGRLADSVRGFPFAGVLLSLPAAAILILCRIVDLGDIATAILVVATLIMTTGALHEDGLADVADGFFGGRTTERRLEIMKDSHIGSYGTLALILIVLLRVILLGDILDEANLLQALLVLIATEAVSRGLLAKFWQVLPSARQGGVADTAGSPQESAANFALLSAIIAGAIAFGFAGGLLAIVLATVLTALMFFGFSRLCQQKIGGYTGDTLGAAQQLATITLQLGLVIAL